MTPEHVPVLMEEVLGALQPLPGQDFIDTTLGLGGHTRAILELTAPDGRILGIDKDPRNLDLAKRNLKEFADRVTLVNCSYKHLSKVSYEHGFNQADGILFDLGFSSLHIEDASRGFALKHEGPLDMRYDPKQKLTAAEIVNDWSESDLAKIFRQLGEERNAHKFAAAIVRERQQERIVTTTTLAKIIASAVPGRGMHGKTHPATRVFQALRIAVNAELDELKVALPQALASLKPGGRIVAISFHSLEDRILKGFFKSEQGRSLELINKKVIKPSREEILANPRARSAKLRAAVKM